MNRNLLVRSQSIATPACYAAVAGDPESGNNGLFYLHSDHLGSATFLTYGNGHASEGNKVPYSTKFYTPFGEYRIQPSYPTSDITDRGFTGHKQNDEIGLIYMNARYFLPTTGRFLSADSIIPYPNDPQSHNRYSYVRNRPLNLNDPTGHCGADTRPNPDGPDVQDESKLAECINLRDGLEDGYGLDIDGIWTLSEMVILRDTIGKIIGRFIEAGLGGDVRDDFKNAFRGATIERRREDGSLLYLPCLCNRAVNAVTTISNKIILYDQAFDVGRDRTDIMRTIAHEFGHIWDRNLSGSSGLKQAVNGRCGFLCLSYNPGDNNAPGSATTPGEDWAETFAAFIVAPDELTARDPNDTRRIDYMKQQILSLEQLAPPLD